MELMAEVKQKGIARFAGFTAHSEEAALRMLELYPFDTVLFPFNWFLNMEHGMGSRLLDVLKQKGIGILAMKAFIERRWNEGEDKGRFPKSWCKPIDTAEDPAFGLDKDSLDTLLDPKLYIGRCPEQVTSFLKNDVEPVLKMYASELDIEEPELNV